MTIAEIFKQVRVAHGLSQEKMAELLDSTQGTISNIEKGVSSNPSYDLVKGLIFVVGANPLFVFGIDSTVNPVMHPAILTDKLRGEKPNEIKNRILTELEDSISKLKSLKD